MPFADTWPGNLSLREADVLDLGKHQRGQAETQLKGAESIVLARIPETYQWILVPVQANPQAPVTFQATRLSGSDALAVRASKKLRSEELLVTSLGPTILRKHLDDVPLWPEGRVSVRQLIDYFATYIYLPRLAGPDVLLGAIRGGLALLTWTSESFAYADSFDEAAARYRGLRAGQNVTVTADSTGLLVKPDIAMPTTRFRGAKTRRPRAGKAHQRRRGHGDCRQSALKRRGRTRRAGTCGSALLWNCDTGSHSRGPRRRQDCGRSDLTSRGPSGCRCDRQARDFSRPS